MALMEVPMDDFAVIYNVLDTLRSQMDLASPNPDAIRPERWNVSANRLDNILVMMQDAGYITGIAVTNWSDVREVSVVMPRITLKGLEYLQENSLMRRAYRLAKGIKDATPLI